MLIQFNKNRPKTPKVTLSFEIKSKCLISDTRIIISLKLNVQLNYTYTCVMCYIEITRITYEQ